MSTIQFISTCAVIVIAMSFLVIYTMQQFVHMGKDTDHYSTFPLKFFRKSKYFKTKRHPIPIHNKIKKVDKPN